MDKVIAAIVKAVLGYIAMWLTAKKAERLEIKIKQIESDVKSRDIERKLAKILNSDLSDLSKADRQKAMSQLMKDRASPAAWNRGKTAKFIPILFFMLAILAQGCLYYEGRWPVIPEAQRPLVPDEPLEWTLRETTLSTYAGSLEDLIGGYNAEAKKHNDENGFDD